MPTIFTHAVVPLAIGAALGQRVVSPRLLAAGALVAMLPDADTVAFKLGIAYADQFGHRGASHSLLIAFVIGLCGAVCAPQLHSTRWTALWWLTLCAASHGVLDAFTDGGLGIALLWPWTETRYFAPLRPIAVSPIGNGFFSLRGLLVLWSELLWVWIPAIGLSAAVFAVRRWAKAHPTIDG